MGKKKETENKVLELMGKVNELQKQLNSLNDEIFLYQGRLVQQKEKEIAEIQDLIKKNTSRRNEIPAKLQELKKKPGLLDDIDNYDRKFKERGGNTEYIVISPDMEEYLVLRQKFKDLNWENAQLSNAIKERNGWITQYKKSEAEHQFTDDQIESVRGIGSGLVKETLEKLCSQRFMLIEQLNIVNKLLDEADKISEAFLDEDNEEVEAELVPEIPKSEEAIIEEDLAYFKENFRNVRN